MASFSEFLLRGGIFHGTLGRIRSKEATIADAFAVSCKSRARRARHRTVTSHGSQGGSRQGGIESPMHGIWPLQEERIMGALGKEIQAENPLGTDGFEFVEYT